MDVTGIEGKEDIEKKIEEFKERRQQIEAIAMTPAERTALVIEISDLEKKIADLETEKVDIEKETDVVEKAKREKNNKEALYEAREALMTAKSKKGQDPKGTEDLDKTIKEAQRHIEQYEEMLKESDNSMDYVQSARQQGTIKQLIKEQQDKIKEAEEQKKAISDRMNSADGKREKMNLFDEEAQFYTQSAMKLQKDLEALRLDMQIVSQRGVTTPTYIYEGVTDERKAQLDEMIANGTDMRHLEVNAMQDKLNELQEAINLCNEQKALVKDEFEKMIAPIQEVLDKTYNQDPKARTEGGEGDHGEHGGEGGEGDHGEHGGEGGEGDHGEHGGEGGTGGTPKPALLNGDAYYSSLGFYDKYKMKAQAYEWVNGEKPQGIVKNLFLMFPRPGYKSIVIRNLSNGNLKPLYGEVPPQEPPKKEEEDKPFGSLSEEEKARINEENRKKAEEMRKAAEAKAKIEADFKALPPEEQEKVLKAMKDLSQSEKPKSKDSGETR